MFKKMKNSQDKPSTTLFKFNETQRYYLPEIPEDITANFAYNRTLNYGEAFAYLYRRFGDSPDKRDSYKDLAVYYLSTPLKSVALVVSPHHEWYPFKCLVDSDTRKKLYQEQKIFIDEFEERFANWCRENNKTVFSKYDWQNTPKQLDYLKSWLILNKIEGYENPDVVLPKELFDQFLAESQDKFVDLRNWYFNNVESLNDLAGDFHKEVQAALMTTIKDLLTPVNIRDWEINILGKI
jgi:hypothetical protein